MATDIISNIDRLKNEPYDVYDDLNDMIKENEITPYEIMKIIKAKADSTTSTEYKKGLALIYAAFIIEYGSSSDFYYKDFSDMLTNYGVLTNLGNKNIAELRTIKKSYLCFTRIYATLAKIAAENDKVAMSFAVRTNYAYVEDTKHTNCFVKAADSNNQDLVRLLIESGFDINAAGESSDTALLCASARGHYEIVKILLAKPDIDVDARGHDNYTALISASKHGQVEIVKLLLDIPGIDVNAKGNGNYTALMLASNEGHHEVVKLLITVPGIDVNAKSRVKSTALIIASKAGYTEIVKLLLSVPGIDVNAKDQFFNTALSHASKKGFHEIEKMLRDHGAN